MSARRTILLLAQAACVAPGAAAGSPSRAGLPRAGAGSLTGEEDR